MTGFPLRIIGMVYFLEIGVGNDVHKQWVPVVPNIYLDAELLLSTCILGEAPFEWNGQANIIVWGNASYVAGQIRRQKGKVEIIQSIPPPLTHNESGDIAKMINLTIPNHVEFYQSQFLPVQAKENQNTTLLVPPQPNVSQQFAVLN